jgi:hypothetical protein
MLWTAEMPRKQASSGMLFDFAAEQGLKPLSLKVKPLEILNGQSTSDAMLLSSLMLGSEEFYVR